MKDLRVTSNSIRSQYSIRSDEKERLSAETMLFHLLKYFFAFW